jgi:hypothetical protein
VDTGAVATDGTEPGEAAAAARVIEVVSGTVSTRPGRKCALVRR